MGGFFWKNSLFFTAIRYGEKAFALMLRVWDFSCCSFWVVWVRVVLHAGGKMFREWCAIATNIRVGLFFFVNKSTV